MKLKNRLSLCSLLLILLISFVAGGCQNKEFELLRTQADEVLQNMTPTKSVTDVKQIVDDPMEVA